LKNGGIEMSLALIITTGGSCEPLVKSIRISNPDYTIFICSADKVSPIREVGSHSMVDGPGKPCEIRGGTSKGGVSMESIVVQTGLGAEYEAYEKVLTSDVDSLDQCYRVATEAILKAKEKKPGCKICADFTGGTKTMSAALAMAAIDQGNIELYIISGPRKDLVKVASGTESQRLVEWMPIKWMRQRRTLEELFKVHDYSSCIELIEELCKQSPRNFDTRKTLEGYLSICRGFQAWEEFRHEEAIEFLNSYGRVLSQELAFLNGIISSYRKYEIQVKAAQGNGEGCAVGVNPNLVLIYDILRNAERRLQKRQYDDAVGRIYRALELLAQTCLLYMHPPIFTSNVAIDKLPNELRTKYQEIYEEQGGVKKGLQLPLFKAYELLNDLNHPLGKVFMEQEERMMGLLEIRNNSIFAHGLKPIEPKKAKDFYEFVCGLITRTECALKLSAKFDKTPQFPVKAPLSLDLHW